MMFHPEANHRSAFLKNQKEISQRDEPPMILCVAEGDDSNWLAGNERTKGEAISRIFFSGR